jgi:hypothetical protein
VQTANDVPARLAEGLLVLKAQWSAHCHAVVGKDPLAVDAWMTSSVEGQPLLSTDEGVADWDDGNASDNTNWARFDQASQAQPVFLLPPPTSPAKRRQVEQAWHSKQAPQDRPTPLMSLREMFPGACLGFFVWCSLSPCSW